MPSPEQLEIQALAREFAETELLPHARSWDERHSFEGDVLGKLAELGFLGMLVPEEFGGLGFGLDTYLLVLEELARADAAVARTVSLHNGGVATLLDVHGSDEQKARWLPSLAEGSVIGALAASVEELESESLGASARRQGGGFAVTGRHERVCDGGRAGLVVLVADADEEGPCVLLARPSDSGYSIVKREETLGLRSSETVRVELQDLEVGSDALVGEPGAGLGCLARPIQVVWIGSAAVALGIGRSAMENAVEYALGREQFGSPIASFGAIQEKLAGMAERLAAGRALAAETAARLQAAEPRWDTALTRPDEDTARAAMTKVIASEAATFAADEAVQVFGGYGYMRHYPVEKLLRDAKGMEINEGTTETLRRIIARTVLDTGSN